MNFRNSRYRFNNIRKLRIRRLRTKMGLFPVTGDVDAGENQLFEPFLGKRLRFFYDGRKRARSDMPTGVGNDAIRTKHIATFLNFQRGTRRRLFRFNRKRIEIRCFLEVLHRNLLFSCLLHLFYQRGKTLSPLCAKKNIHFRKSRKSLCRHLRIAPHYCNDRMGILPFHLAHLLATFCI